MLLARRLTVSPLDSRQRCRSCDSSLGSSSTHHVEECQTKQLCKNHARKGHSEHVQEPHSKTNVGHFVQRSATSLKIDHEKRPNLTTNFSSRGRRQGRQPLNPARGVDALTGRGIHLTWHISFCEAEWDCVPLAADLSKTCKTRGFLLFFTM